MKTIGIDAAVEWDKGKAFFFKGMNYIRYDIKADHQDYDYPQPINRSNWDEVYLFAKGDYPDPWNIDAIVNWGNGKAYFFKGNTYCRYDIKKDKVDYGYSRRLIKGNWPGLEKFDYKIDAAVNFGKGKAFFFKGNQYIRYDIKKDRADEDYPQNITDSNWEGLEDFAKEGIDAVFTNGKGKAFFFKGNKYIRYDIDKDRADEDYPQEIEDGNWPWIRVWVNNPGDYGPWANENPKEEGTSR